MCLLFVLFHVCCFTAPRLAVSCLLYVLAISNNKKTSAYDLFFASLLCAVLCVLSFVCTCVVVIVG